MQISSEMTPAIFLSRDPYYLRNLNESLQGIANHGDSEQAVQSHRRGPLERAYRESSEWHVDSIPFSYSEIGRDPD